MNINIHLTHIHLYIIQGKDQFKKQLNSVQSSHGRDAMVKIIYNKIFNPSKLTEGQDLSDDDFEVLALDRRIENSLKLIAEFKPKTEV